MISNADAVRTHRELLGGVKKFERRRRYEPACSGVVLYLGLKRQPEQLLHHNFIFSRDPHEEFDFIYRQGEPAPDPTCYVCAPARTDPAVAPEGGEALYVLVHAPYLRKHHDWKKMLPKYREVILRKLRRTAGLEIEKEIVTESALTPQDIHDRYGVLNGAIYGIASHGRWLGAFKPSNRSPDLHGLYLAGGAAHPGPGMPMVLMSGWIAADAIDQDFGGAPLNGRRAAGRAADAPGAGVRTPGRVPAISQPLLALFSRYAAWYLGKHFHSVRLLASAAPPNDPPGPLVVFLNHAAWWDPLVCLVLRREFFRGRSAYAPIEAAALARYRFLERLGFFAVETGTTRGAAQFLRTAGGDFGSGTGARSFSRPRGNLPTCARRWSSRRGSIIWRIARRGAVFLPLAIEYSFWEERKPEVLLAFGEALPATESGALVGRLADLQARLAAVAARRQPNEWTILRKSRSGVSLPYDLWRGLRARLRGEAFRADHGRL